MAVENKKAHHLRTTAIGTSPALQIAAFILMAAALSLAREILIPLALAVLLSFLLVYPVSYLERWRLGRLPAVCVVALLAVAILGSLGWLVFEQTSDLIAELPKHSREIEGKLSGLRKHIYASRFEVKQVLEKVAKVMEPRKGEEAPLAGREDSPSADSNETPMLPANSPFSLSSEDHPIIVRVMDPPIGLFHQFLASLGPLVYPMSQVVMVTVLVIFMLLRREDLRNRMIHVLSRGRLQGTMQAINDATSRVGRYLVIQSLINGGYGVVVGISLLVLGVPSWALWGVLAAAFRFLPYIGPWLGSVPPLLLLVATSDGWQVPLVAIGLFAGLEFCVSFLLEPWLYGVSTGVSSFAIFVAAVFWTWLWGPIGLILATPLTVCLVVAGKYLPQLRYFNVLLGDEEPLSPGEKYYQRLLAENPGDAATLVQDARRRQTEVEVYDSILLPALVLADNEALAGDLTEETFAAILGHTREMAAIPVIDKDANGKEPSVEDSSKPSEGVDLQPRPCVICIPAHDEVDVIAGEMLSRFLVHGGYRVSQLSGELLVSEVIGRVDDSSADVACIIALATAARGHARALAKRLKARLPNLTLVVWQSATDPITAFEADASTMSASDTIAALHRLGFTASPTPAQASGSLTPASAAA